MVHWVAYLHRRIFLATLLLLTLCQACQQQPNPAPTVERPDTVANAQPPQQDSIQEDRKMPFEFDIDTLYHGQIPSPSTGYYGEFTGEEPWWSIHFQGKTLVWRNPETADVVKEKVTFSMEAYTGFVVAFQSSHLFGIVKRSCDDACNYCGIVDSTYMPMDIYFNAAGRTHVGCGKLKGVDLRR
jgi:uncharacterized membrane protein